jgi:hypothetical protein
MQVAKPVQTDREWLELREACVYTGRSLTAIKEWISKGKIRKRLVPKPGARPRVELWREDLDRLFREPVQIPVVAEPGRTSLVRSGMDGAPSELVQTALAKLGEWLARPQVELKDRLCWTMREARVATGLSRPALGELAEAHPECVLRRGRRTWFKAGKLREVLG